MLLEVLVETLICGQDMMVNINMENIKIDLKGDIKTLRSPNYNYNFNCLTGQFVRWGKSAKDDPLFAPFPEILDIEVTEVCAGPRNRGCPFCSPAGTLINTPEGEKAIEDIRVGDKVWASTSLKSKPKLVFNEVKELYKREYKGEIITIELEDGTKLKLTPNHPIIVKGGIEVLAEDLKESHEIIHISDFQQCKQCNKPVTALNRVKRYFCSAECHEKSKTLCNCLICGRDFKGRKKQKFCSQCVDRSGVSSKHPLVSIWSHMMYRCYDPKRNVYAYYGGAGIQVDKRWHTLANFIEDMYATYTKGLEIERKDNTQNYSKDNCVWLNKREQRVHRRQPESSLNPYKGVASYKGGRFLVTCCGDYLGIFNTEQSAVQAYNKHILKLFPENGGKYVQNMQQEGSK